METFNVGKIEEFEDKSKKVVTIGDEEVGVFRLGDEFFAWRNICPCLLYTSPSPRDLSTSRMPSSA